MQTSKYVEINGVRRFEATCNSESLYNYANAGESITIPRRLLEREIRRVIEEAMVEGGMITDLANNCMMALDADALSGADLV